MSGNNKRDCMDAGGTTARTQEVEQRREQLPRATQGAVADDGMDARLATTAIVQPRIKMVRYRLDVGSKQQVTSEELKKY